MKIFLSFFHFTLLRDEAEKPEKERERDFIGFVESFLRDVSYSSLSLSRCSNWKLFPDARSKEIDVRAALNSREMEKRNFVVHAHLVCWENTRCLGKRKGYDMTATLFSVGVS